MPPPQATEDLYATLQRYQLLLVFGARRLWRSMTPDFDRSWSGIAPSLEMLTTGAQLAAATAAVAYVPQVLAETNQPDEPEARVRPRAFSGVASDGRSLAGLLVGSVVASKRAVVRGLDGGDALALGEKWLEQALQTAVADAARDATAASIIARPQIGYVRMVNPPCCSRCAVLAGRVYKWNSGFLRHPGCDCLHIPSTVANADSFLADPNELVKRGLITDLSQGQRDRLADGADLSKVLNESRDRWRVRMAADRRAARRANYTPAEARAADRRARARVASGEDIKTVHDFMASLTSRVEALDGLRAAGIAD